MKYRVWTRGGEPVLAAVLNPATPARNRNRVLDAFCVAQDDLHADGQHDTDEPPTLALAYDAATEAAILDDTAG